MCVESMATRTLPGRARAARPMPFAHTERSTSTFLPAILPDEGWSYELGYQIGTATVRRSVSALVIAAAVIGLTRNRGESPVGGCQRYPAPHGNS